jgi:O-antigen/teichoic acid export membrane protein
MSAFYFLSREPEKRPFTIFNILLFNFIAGGLACLGLFFYPQFLGNIFKSEEMTRLAPEIGVVIWLWVFSTFLEIVALANQETRLAAAFIILAQFTKTVLMAGAVVFFSTVEAFLDAAIIQAVIQTGFLLWYLNSRFPKFWKSFSFPFFREQLIYALPFGMVGLVYTLQIDVHNYFVGHRFSEREFAIYAYGCFSLPLVGMLYESISGVMIPRMSELEAQGKKREMFLTTVSAMKKLAFAYFPLFVFMMIVAEEFITTLFTKDYAASVPIFRINLLLLPFYCLMIDPIARAFPAVGQFLLKTRSALFFALLAALWFGIQYFDLRGMIAIAVAIILFEKLISMIKILKILEVRAADIYLLKNFGKTGAAALLAGIILFLFYWTTRNSLPEACLNFSRSLLVFVKFEKASELLGGSLFLGICATLYFGVYFFLAFRLGALEDSEKERIKEMVSRRWTTVRNLIRRKKDEPLTTNNEHLTKSGHEMPTDPRPLTTDL